MVVIKKVKFDVAEWSNIPPIITRTFEELLQQFNFLPEFLELIESQMADLVAKSQSNQGVVERTYQRVLQVEQEAQKERDERARLADQLRDNFEEKVQRLDGKVGKVAETVQVVANATGVLEDQLSENFAELDSKLGLEQSERKSETGDLRGQLKTSSTNLYQLISDQALKLTELFTTQLEKSAAVQVEMKKVMDERDVASTQRFDVLEKEVDVRFETINGRCERGFEEAKVSTKRVENSLDAFKAVEKTKRKKMKVKAKETSASVEKLEQYTQKRFEETAKKQQESEDKLRIKLSDLQVELKAADMAAVERHVQAMETHKELAKKVHRQEQELIATITKDREVSEEKFEEQSERITSLSEVQKDQESAAKKRFEDMELDVMHLSQQVAQESEIRSAELLRVDSVTKKMVANVGEFMTDMSKQVKDCREESQTNAHECRQLVEESVNSVASQLHYVERNITKMLEDSPNYARLSEARFFALEARLREEENTRISEEMHLKTQIGALADDVSTAVVTGGLSSPRPAAGAGSGGATKPKASPSVAGSSYNLPAGFGGSALRASREAAAAAAVTAAANAASNQPSLRLDALIVSGLNPPSPPRSSRIITSSDSSLQQQAQQQQQQTPRAELPKEERQKIALVNQLQTTPQVQVPSLSLSLSASRAALSDPASVLPSPSISSISLQRSSTFSSASARDNRVSSRVSDGPGPWASGDAGPLTAPGTPRAPAPPSKDNSRANSRHRPSSAGSTTPRKTFEFPASSSSLDASALPEVSSRSNMVTSNSISSLKTLASFETPGTPRRK